MSDLARGIVQDYVDARISDREPDGRWHPSGLFLCERQAVYAVRGTERTAGPDDKLRRIFHLGNVFHTQVQEAVTEAVGSRGIVRVSHEVSVSTPESVEGHCDSLVEYADGTYETWEYKSIGYNALRYAKELPKDYHTQQGLTYALQMRRYPFVIDGVEYGPLGDAMRGTRVVYLGKDSLEVLDFEVPLTDEWIAQFDAYRLRLESFRESGLPPRLPLNKGSKPWTCTSCDWQARCYSDPAQEAA